MSREYTETEWLERYDRWQTDCLDEWNTEHAGTSFGQKTLEDDGPNRIEFAENGDAYPHGIGGTGHVRRAVTPWEASPHHLG